MTGHYKRKYRKKEKDKKIKRSMKSTMD